MKFAEILTACILTCLALAAVADDSAIRKNLAERMPHLGPVDEITPTQMAGIFEIRLGNSIVYTDTNATTLFQGDMVDTRSKRNLTQERVSKLSEIVFSALPVADSITIVRGSGKHKVAVFEDPNCGYCKRIERELLKLSDITVNVYLLPILGQDSMEKSKAIWCSSDKSKAWLDWIVNSLPIPAPATACDTTALNRNLELASKHRVRGTPTLVFESGKRVPGAINEVQIRKHLSEPASSGR